MEEEWAERLAMADAALDAELEQWKAEKLNPQAWRMGDHEILIRTEILVLMDIMMEHYGITQDEMNVRLKERLAQEFRALRPEMVKQKKAQIRAMIQNGIRPGS